MKDDCENDCRIEVNQKEKNEIMKPIITKPVIKFVVQYLITFLFTKLIIRFVIRWYEVEPEYSQALRVGTVIEYQFLMFLPSKFIYYRMTNLLPDQSIIFSNRRQSLYSIKFSSLYNIGIITFLVLAHLVYFNYWYVLLWPSLYVWLSAICHGYYIHIIAFLLPFVFWEAFAYVIVTFKLPLQSIKTFLLRFKDILLSENYHTMMALVLAFLIGSLQFLGPFNYTIRHYSIPISRSHPQIKHVDPPFRLVVLSDIHMGAVISKAQLLNVVAVANEQKPDIIVIDGDLVDGSVQGIGNELTPLAFLQTKYGVYYVSGNHEFYYGNYDEWAALLRTQYKIRVLDNEASNVNNQICLIGFDEHVDSIEGRIESVLEQVAWNNTSDCAGIKSQPHILLAHNPRISKYIVDNDETVGKVQLIINGHIHAGQFYVTAPLLYMAIPYYWGWYQSYQRADGIRTPHVYVSAGTHFWMAPMKMLNTAEITVLDIS